jgi:hypothetical protein
MSVPEEGHGSGMVLGMGVFWIIASLYSVQNGRA